MSLTIASKVTVAGTTYDSTTSTILADFRMYDNESTYVGYGASTSNLYGVRNTVIGYEACLNSKSGGNNVVLGSYAAKDLSGNNNVVIGADTARLLQNGSDNIIIGKNTLQRTSLCQGNIAIGSLTGYGLKDGTNNVFIGNNVFRSGFNTLNYNTIIGSLSDGYGSCNAAFGHTNIINGDNNIVFGNNNLISSTQSLVLGDNNKNTGTNAIIIGNNLDNTLDNLTNINNKLLISDIETSIINSNICIQDINSGSEIFLSNHNIQVNSIGYFKSICDVYCESNIYCKNVIDASIINVNNVAQFNSNIEIRWNDTEYWKIGLTNKNDDSADLSFVSKNKTFFTITDEFKPEILNFTGKHRCKFIEESIGDDVQIGMVVISTGEYCNLNDKQIIDIDESIPIVDLSRSAMDSRSFGVICGFESDNDMRTYNVGNIQFQVEKKSSRIIVNAVGEGAILVCNQNGIINNGDFLTTSDIKGYAMKQTSNICMNYTIAKATCDCYFENETTKLIGCTYKF